MAKQEIRDIRGVFLRWLLPFIFILLVFEIILIFYMDETTNEKKIAYYLLLSTLLVVCAVTLYFTLRKNHKLSSYLTMFLAIAGTWGSVLIEFTHPSADFFPLLFVSLNVVFSSLLLPLAFTVFLSIIQAICVHLILIADPNITKEMLGSFLSFVLVISVLSIITSYINKVQMKQLKESSIKDHLTQIFNRRYFDETLDYWIERATTKKNTLGVVLIDVDNFKGYNDNYGHLVGDALLKFISSFLVNESNLHDIVCRYGGDEFAVIVTDSTHENIYEIACHVTALMSEIDFTAQGFNFNSVTLSMGLAFFPTNGVTKKELIQYADKNLLKAKELGKNQVVF